VIFGRENDKRRVSIEAPCFKETSLTYTEIDSKTIEVTIDTSKASSWLCTVIYIFSINFIFFNRISTSSLLHLISTYETSSSEVGRFLAFGSNFFEGKHVIRFKNLSEKEFLNIKHYGLHIYRFCSSIVDSIGKKKLLFL